jgi:copper(I)-binding protein
LAAGVLVLAACSGSSATVKAVTASKAWARPTPAAATNGVVYLTLASPVDDAIVSAAVPASIAGGAELHETMVTGGTSPMANMPQMAGDGTMTMMPVASVPVARNSSVEFTPGGKHIMLTHLAHPLTLGEHFTLTVHLRVAGDVPIDVVVSNEIPGS